MDYRMLYEKLVAEAEENGLGGEFVDWGISISKWRADPVALALYGWLLENEPEGMAWGGRTGKRRLPCDARPVEHGAQRGERGHDRGDSRSGVLLGASGRCSKPRRGQREPF